jgi:hypothetical protein
MGVCGVGPRFPPPKTRRRHTCHHRFLTRMKLLPIDEGNDTTADHLHRTAHPIDARAVHASSFYSIPCFRYGCVMALAPNRSVCSSLCARAVTYGSWLAGRCDVAGIAAAARLRSARDAAPEEWKAIFYGVAVSVPPTIGAAKQSPTMSFR